MCTSMANDVRFLQGFISNVEPVRDVVGDELPILGMLPACVQACFRCLRNGIASKTCIGGLECPRARQLKVWVIDSDLTVAHRGDLEVSRPNPPFLIKHFWPPGLATASPQIKLHLGGSTLSPHIQFRREKHFWPPGLATASPQIIKLHL